MRAGRGCTPGACRGLRESRRAEIESDLWESQCDADWNHSSGTALYIVLRLLIGIPDDLGWRVEQEAIAGRLTQASIVLSARVAGAALFICALWVIDADASRKRPIPARPSRCRSRPSNGGIMTMLDGHVSRGGRKLPLLAAGIAATVAVAMVRTSPPAFKRRSQPLRVPHFEAALRQTEQIRLQRLDIRSSARRRLVATNATAALLIRFAYKLPDFQMSGGPDWLHSDRFDVIAKAAGNPPLEQMRLMLRRLLAERFKLNAHTETRELPIYALVMARKDGRIGPRLRRTEADCARADHPPWSASAPAHRTARHAAASLGLPRAPISRRDGEALRFED